tara:strand:+ start:618 stop:866 length:249 start_codon:yes stop_codon:yes gene_type:complete
MPGGVKKQMIDTSIGLPTNEIGSISFAAGNREKKFYSLGFSAAIDLVMEYWKNGEDISTAETNIEFIKEKLFDNSTMDRGGK